MNNRVTWEPTVDEKDLKYYLVWRKKERWILAAKPKGKVGEEIPDATSITSLANATLMDLSNPATENGYIEEVYLYLGEGDRKFKGRIWIRVFKETSPNQFSMVRQVQTEALDGKPTGWNLIQLAEDTKIEKGEYLGAYVITDTYLYRMESKIGSQYVRAPGNVTVLDGTSGVSDYALGLYAVVKEPNYEPDEDWRPIQRVFNTTYDDLFLEPGRYHYRIEAVDISDNVSLVSDELVTIIRDFKFKLNVDMQEDRVLLQGEWLGNPEDIYSRPNPITYIWQRRLLLRHEDGSYVWTDWKHVGTTNSLDYLDILPELGQLYSNDPADAGAPNSFRIEYRAFAYDALNAVIGKTPTNAIMYYNFMPPNPPDVKPDPTVKYGMRLTMTPAIRSVADLNDTFPVEKQHLYWPMMLEIEANLTAKSPLLFPDELNNEKSTGWITRSIIRGNEAVLYDDITDMLSRVDFVTADSGQMIGAYDKDAQFNVLFRMRYRFSSGKIASNWTQQIPHRTEEVSPGQTRKKGISTQFIWAAQGIHKMTPLLEFTGDPDIVSFRCHAALLPGPRIDITWDAAVIEENTEKFQLYKMMEFKSGNNWFAATEFPEMIPIYAGSMSRFQDMDIVFPKYANPGVRISYQVALIDRWANVHWSSKEILYLDSNATAIKDNSPHVTGRHFILEDLAPIFTQDSGLPYLWDRGDQATDKKAPAAWASGYWPKTKIWFKETVTPYVWYYMIRYGIVGAGGQWADFGPGVPNPNPRDMIVKESPVVISYAPDYGRSDKIYCQLAVVDVFGNIEWSTKFTIWPRAMGTTVDPSIIPYEFLDNRDYSDKIYEGGIFG